MKSAIVFLLLLGFMIFLVSTRPTNIKDSNLVSRAAALCKAQTRTVDSFLQQYPHYFYDSGYSVRELKYEQLAYHLRTIAGFIIYINPEIYRQRLAGPFQFQKRNEIKGFLGIMPDAFLFQGPLGTEPDSETGNSANILPVKNFIAGAANRFQSVIQEMNCPVKIQNMNESALFDALRTEIFRISTVDVGNSDFNIDEAALPGLRGSVDSWLQYGGLLVEELPATASDVKERWRKLSSATKSFLYLNRDFQSFNRMSFIKDYLLPLSKWLYEVQVVLQIPFISRRSAWRTDATSIYDNVFNGDYYAPDSAGYYSIEKAHLGELLFFDPVLSQNGQRACASCHKPSQGFTDGRKKSISFDFDDLPRNSPTIIGTGFQQRLFWDARAASLEDQLDSVINNPHELNGSFPNLVARLNASLEYVHLFKQAFPKTGGKTITVEKIKHAIAVFERSLSGLNSRFDQYMHGDNTKLTQQEIHGFNVFMGKARCGVCHFAPLFNGSIPPFFDKVDDHALGVMIKDSMVKYKLDADPGVMKVTGNMFRLRSFKVPTIRNTALTAPYMHNGVFKTLEQVIDFYDKGAGNAFSKDVRPDMHSLPFFTILPIPLNLTTEDKKDVVAFLKSLTDTSGVKKVPGTLPAFKKPYINLNKRKPGGEY
jgi:cytochrome c peroxidase